MKNPEKEIDILVPENSALSHNDYIKFIYDSRDLLKQYPLYFAGSEDIDSLEIAHLIPEVKETILTIYIGINEAVCNKGLVTPFLPRHAHNNVFVFDPEIYSGGADVPEGTVDAKNIINGFLPPNLSWSDGWTYVMISDPARSFSSLWKEKGYIDMIPAKFEDFTMISDHNKSRVCTFIDPEAFNHPVNKSRAYLKRARLDGEKLYSEFTIPELIKGETEGLVPVILNQGEKLYVARPDFQPCAHCWSNIHPNNEQYAVVNENSAIPLNLVIQKPMVNEKYINQLVPPAGSADNTTDWFYRGDILYRKPIKPGHISG